MTEQGQPVPQRIGDVERDRAVDLLRDHMAAGRLTAEEFDERLGTALSARTSADLDPLFTDLPGPRPGQGMALPPQNPSWQAAAPVPAPSEPAPPAVTEPRDNPVLAIVTAVMWPATILAITFVFGWSHFWWLVFVPIVISSMLGKDTHDRRDRERRRIEHDQAQLDRRRRALGD